METRLLTLRYLQIHLSYTDEVSEPRFQLEMALAYYKDFNGEGLCSHTKMSYNKIYLVHKPAKCLLQITSILKT